MMTRKLWIMALVLALVAPAGLVAAGQHEGNDDEADEGPPEDVGNESEEDANESGEDADRRMAPPSGFEQNGTLFDGEHVTFTLDAGLPGIQDLTVEPNATPLIAQVALPTGDEAEWETEGPVFELESNESQLKVWDLTRAVLHVEADEDAPATITVADGVNVSLHARDAGDDDDDEEDDEENGTDDDGDAIYRLQLPDDRTFYLVGDGLEHDDGTFTVADEATVAALPTEIDDRMEEAREHMEERREEARERMEEARERMQEAREKRSHFSEENGTITGQYVSFQAGETGIQAYHLNAPNVTVFDAVELGPNATDRMGGASYEMRTEETRLQAIDQPHGLLVLQARDNGTLEITLAEGVNATLRAQDEATDDEDDDDEEDDEATRSLYELSLPGNLTAMLAGEDLVATGNGTFELTGQAQFRLRTMAAHPYEGDDDDEDEEDEEDRRGPPAHARARALDARASERVQEAIAMGQVAVEVYADGEDGEPVAVELGHVRVRSASTQAEGPVKAQVEIEAEDGSPGTSVVLNLNRADLGNLTVAQAASELAVRYDGENISAADDLEDALDWANDDGEAEYLLLVGGEQIQVFVTVPHFSPHTVEVYQAQTQSEDEANVEDGANGTPLPGLLATLAVGLAAAAVTRTTRRED